MGRSATRYFNSLADAENTLVKKWGYQVNHQKTKPNSFVYFKKVGDEIKEAVCASHSKGIKCQIQTITENV